MRNKRGQFYIVAAIIIVLVLAGIASVKTYAVVRPEPRVIQDLGSELQEETSRIIDYGIYNSATESLSDILNSFTDSEFAPYFLQKTSDTGIVFVYGNKDGLTAVQYKSQSTGVLSATIGTSVTNWSPVTDIAERVIVEITDPLNVTLLGKSFEFDLQDNEMFYFVIVQEKDGETYIERN